ncbi:hypothetical protein O988_06800 [Pseudogymnoascus sp. VKM F-3808]|nr:hypothetical protein O988_06800 [Pseudogymnoascus sp. VKM F-3808]
MAWEFYRALIARLVLRPAPVPLLGSFSSLAQNFTMEKYVEKTLACLPANMSLTTATRTLVGIGGYIQHLVAHSPPIPPLTTTHTLLKEGEGFVQPLINPRPVYLFATPTHTLLKFGKHLESVLVSSSLQTIALAAIFIAVFAHLVIGYLTQVRYPPNLPRVREPAGATRFSLKTRWDYYTDCKSLYKEAYETYSKHGKTCLLPGLGFRNEVIIPGASLRWYTSQPDHVLSSYEAFIELNQAVYTTGDANVIRNPWQAKLVRTQMLSLIEPIVADLNDELKISIDEKFGMDEEEWRELDLYEMVRIVIAQGSSRFTVGIPLCRDETYLKRTIDYIDNTINGGVFIGILPRPIRPLFGSLFRIITHLHLRSIRNSLSPLFHARLPLLQTPPGPDEPLDHLQMMLRYAAANCPSELNLTNFTARLSVSNSGSFHQASMAITNTLFNILDSDAEYSTINALREEAVAALNEHNGVWTKATAAQMTKMDSVCRETLRLHAFANRAVFKRVVADSLVTEDGITLPKGAMLSLLAQPAQTDPEVFDAPMTFDPFRFSRAREAITDDSNLPSSPHPIVPDSEKASSNGPPPHPPGKLPLISTSAINLPFAHGRHACPGRFIVDFEMKIMLAYLLMHYDIVVVKRDKPWREWAAEASMLVKGGKVSVRRRGTME